MTRKDYRKLAGILHNAAFSAKTGEVATAVVDDIVRHCVEWLKADNSSFDRERFFRAIETGKECS